jgi:hypothetical protein
MNKFYIGQIFTGKYPPEAAIWCNGNNAHIEKNGSMYTIVENHKNVTTKAELSEFIYQEKCKVAYGGVTVKQDGNEYTFETTKDSITMCNSRVLAIATKPDDFIISWKVWQDDIPTVLNITKAEFLSIFAFGSEMIDAAFAVEGALNAEIQQLTVEQLSNDKYINDFKENAILQFKNINKIFVFI